MNQFSFFASNHQRSWKATATILTQKCRRKKPTFQYLKVHEKEAQKNVLYFHSIFVWFKSKRSFLPSRTRPIWNCAKVYANFIKRFCPLVLELKIILLNAHVIERLSEGRRGSYFLLVINFSTFFKESWRHKSKDLWSKFSKWNGFLICIIERK